MTLRLRSMPLLWATLLAVLVVSAYWPGLGGGFVFDDFPNIVDNTRLHVASLGWQEWLAAAFSSEAGQLQRPLAMITFALNHYFTGLDPMPMKLFNVAIHAVNAWLVLWLARRLLMAAGLPESPRRAWAARFVAAAWALHPINLMPVLLVVQRMESLAHVFVFAGLGAYLVGRHRQMAGSPGWRWILAGIGGGTALGMLAKESAALLPLYALCVEACVLRFRGAGGRDRMLQAFHVMVAVIPTTLGLAWLLDKGLDSGAWTIRGFSMADRLMTEARVLVEYLCWTLFPSLRELSLYHDGIEVSRGLWSPPTTLLAIGLLAGLGALAAWLRRRRPLASLGVCWFLAAHLLTATFLPLELVFEHRNYFASLGIVLALTDLVFLARPALARSIALLWLLALAATTHLRAREWSDPLRFAASEVEKQPDSPRATYAWGRMLAVASDYRADSPLLPEAFAALERARHVPGSNALPEQSLIVLAARTGRPLQPEWWQGLQQKLRRKPPGPQDEVALRNLLECAERRACAFPDRQMRATFEAALSHGPDPDILTLQGAYVLNVAREPVEALALWRGVASAHPGVAQYQINLTKLLVALGRYDEAQSRIDALRGLGRFGQHQIDARQLQKRLEAAKRADAVD